MEQLLHFKEDEIVLFLGEGNFSFSASILAQKSYRKIIVSCFESTPVSDQAELNIEKLKRIKNVEVKFGIDATKLSEKFEKEFFSKIIFMFPHVGGKMRIDLNRNLLRKFNESCSLVLRENGSVFVALCAGQSGSEQDPVQRPREADTWQIVKLFNQFQAVQIESFNPASINGYTSYGYRGLNKNFNNHSAVMHVFKKPEFNFQAELKKCGKREKFFLHNAAIIIKKLFKDIKVVFNDEESETFPFIRIKFNFSKDFSLNPLKIDLSTEDGISINLHAKIFQSDNNWRSHWTLQENFSPPLYPNQDLSFWVDSDLNFDLIFDLLWRVGGDFINSVEILDSSYLKGSKRSLTLRLSYRSFLFPIEDVQFLHREVVGAALVEECKVQLR